MSAVPKKAKTLARIEVLLRDVLRSDPDAVLVVVLSYDEQAAELISNVNPERREQLLQALMAGNRRGLCRIKDIRD